MEIISVKAQLSKAFSIQPSEVDKMPFWEFELYMKELERLVKEENKQQEDEMHRRGADKAMKMANPNNMSKMMGSTTDSVMSKMPNMSKMSMGSMKMPTKF